LIFEKLALKIDIIEDGGGTLDIFSIRMMLIKAILEPGKGDVFWMINQRPEGSFLKFSSDMALIESRVNASSCEHNLVENGRSN